MGQDEKILTLKNNVKQLIEVCNTQKASNLRISAALKAEQTAREKLEAKVKQLEGQFEALSVAKSMENTNTTAKVARARVNNLIKQIDKCIAQLNR